MPISTAKSANRASAMLKLSSWERLSHSGSDGATGFCLDHFEGNAGRELQQFESGGGDFQNAEIRNDQIHHANIRRSTCGM